MSSSSTASLKVLILSWNTDGVRLCDTASQAVADNLRERAKGKLFSSQPAACVSPNFFEAVRSNIASTNPDVIAVSTQADSNKSLFHDTFLPNTLSQLGYVLVRKESVRDMRDSVESGTSNQAPSSLRDDSVSTRLSVYVMATMSSDFKFEEKGLDAYFSSLPSSHSCSTSQVAVGCYLEHKRVGRLLFVATHLTSAMQKTQPKADILAQRTIFRNNSSTCSIKMLQAFTDDLPENKKPRHVFYLGSFGYNISKPGATDDSIIADIVRDSSSTGMRQLQPFDELIQMKTKGELPYTRFSEGVNGEGPLFPPTWQMRQGRGAECSDDSSMKQNCYVAGSGIGWHDRILYRDYSNLTAASTTCTKYGRLDISNQSYSRCGGVHGEFLIR